MSTRWFYAKGDGDFEIATKRHNQIQQLSADGVQHGAAPGCNADLPTHKKSHLPLVAAPCTLTDVAAVPPRGVEQLGCFPGKARGSGFGFSRKRSRLHFQPTPGPATAVAHRCLADAEQGRPAADHAAGRLPETHFRALMMS